MKAADWIGDEVTYTRPNGKRVSGRVVGVRESGTTIYNGDESWPGIQFQLEVKGRREWTPTFPDRVASKRECESYQPEAGE